MSPLEYNSGIVCWWRLLVQASWWHHTCHKRQKAIILIGKQRIVQHHFLSMTNISKPKSLWHINYSNLEVRSLCSLYTTMKLMIIWSNISQTSCYVHTYSDHRNLCTLRWTVSVRELALRFFWYWLTVDAQKYQWLSHRTDIVDVFLETEDAMRNHTQTLSVSVNLLIVWFCSAVAAVG